MKYLTIFTILLLSVACQNSTANKEITTKDTPDAKPTVVSLVVNQAEFQKNLNAKSNAYLLDVRTPEETAGGMIEGASNIDFRATDFKDKLAALDNSKPVFVYCHSGGRSGKAAGMLKELGFKEIYDLKGGYSNWK